MILSSLSEFPVVFRGGTYLWFFHGLNRFSEDLDFTSTGRLKSDIPGLISKRLKLIGVENQLRIIKDDKLGLSFRILANGPLNTGEKDRCSVYVEISKREKLQSNPISLSLDIPGYLIPVRLVSGMNLTEVASEKVRAILTRSKSRDIFDLEFLIRAKNVKFNREEINIKMKFYNKGFHGNDLILEIKKRLPGMKRELRSMGLDNFSWDQDFVNTISNWIQ